MWTDGVANPIRIAFIGSSLPSCHCGSLPGFSQAGALFQEGLLDGLAKSGLRASEVFSVRPVPSFPRYRRLRFRSETVVRAGDSEFVMLPFLNAGPLKTCTLGLAILLSVLRWGWRTRRQGGRPVVLQYNVSSPPACAALLATRIVRGKMLAVVVDLQVPGSGLLPDTLLRRLEYRLQRWVLPRLDGLVGLPSIASDFAPDVPFLKLDGGVCNPQPTPATTERPSANANSDALFVVMYAGNLSALQGVPLLLRAFSRLGADDLRLWISGRGDLQAEVEEAARSDRRITYLGYLGREELHAHYARASVLVNPHSTEHKSSRYLFPSKLIEYLAAGRPVITTCGEGIEAEYGSYVILLREEAPDVLARLIEELRTESRWSLEALGTRARAFALREKSWRTQGHRLASFVDVVAGEGR